MPWKLAGEIDKGGTIHVTRLEEHDEEGRVQRAAQLQTAIPVPQSGQGRGQAIAAIRQKIAEIVAQGRGRPAAIETLENEVNQGL